MPIKFGPAGIGGVKEAVSNLEEYHRLGLKACEIAFTYGVYIKRQEDAEKIGKTAEKLGIDLSIHAPYWINLNSADKEKIEKSKERILKCLEVGTLLKAKKIVFHPGYYGSVNHEETYENIKNAILDIEKKRKDRGYTPKLAPKTSGKINVFGSFEEIHRLVSDTKCSFCIDFAHILAKHKRYMFEEIIDRFKDEENWHVHFSGIEYNEKGERSHKKTPAEEIKSFFQAFQKTKKLQ